MNTARFVAVVLVLSLVSLGITTADAHDVSGSAPYPLQQDVYVPATNLFMGTYQYTIPISTPDGRSGIQPALSLRYDSSGPSSWIGRGWDLNLGTIERSTKKGANYAGDDYVLTFNGVRTELVYDAAVDKYWEKYQTAFYRIAKVGTSPTDFYWLVTDKKGTQYYFGKSAADRQVNPSAPDAGKIFGWRLDYIVDSNKNAMSVSYASDQGQLYPSKIEYTSVDGDATKFPVYEIDFVLESWGCPTTGSCQSAPLGSPVSYRSHYAIATAKRLKTIKISGREVAGGALSLIRAYALTYLHDTNTNQDQLNTVQQYGRDATIDGAGNITNAATASALPPVTLSYADTVGSSQTSGAISVYTEVTPPFTPVLGDFNGDGRGDIALEVDLHGGGTGWAVCLTNGTQLSCPSGPTGNSSLCGGACDPYFYPGVQGVFTEQPQLVADYNGDGKADLLLHNADGTWQLCISGISGPFISQAINQTYTCKPLVNVTSGTNITGDLKVGDFDGDGFADIFMVPAAGHSGGTCFHKTPFDGSSFTCNTSVPPLQSGMTMYVGDFNGDRMADILQMSAGSGGASYICYSTGSPTSTWPAANSANCGSASNSGLAVSGNLVADFNGDGLMDIAEFIPAPNGVLPSIKACLSTGNSAASGNTFSCFAPQQFTGPSGEFFNQSTNADIQAGDFNGDGFADVMGTSGLDGSKKLVCLSGGPNSYFNCTAVAVFGSLGDPGIAADMTGDGNSDIWTKDGYVNFDQFISGQLQSINNGMGGSIFVTYGSSRDNYATSYESDLHYPVRLVRSVSVCCANGHDAVTTYDYYDGAYSIAQHEFRGFARVVVTTPTGPNGESSTETTTFNRGDATGNINAVDAYWAGKPSRVVISDNHTTEDTIYTYKDDPVAPHFNPLVTIQKDDYLTDGTARLSTKEERDYDDYGNLTIVKQYGDTSIAGDERLIRKTYATTATDSWMVGLPINEKMYSGLVEDAAKEVSETAYYYDSAQVCDTLSTNQLPIIGDKLQRISRKLFTTDPMTFTWVDETTGNDALGNVLCRKDADGNPTSFGYDGNAMFLTTTTNALSQPTISQFYGVADDNGYIGQLKSVTDPNNAVSTKVYDKLGRITQEYGPLSPANEPLATYAYPAVSGGGSNGNYGDVGAQNSSRTMAGDYSNYPASNQVYQDFFDGFGRIIKRARLPSTLSGAAAGGIVRDSVYDVRGQLAQESLPYYANDSANSGANRKWITYNRDAFGRVTRVSYPDGSQSLACAGGPWTVEIGRYWPSPTATTPDGKDEVRRSTRDGLGRLIKVEEYSPTTSNSLTACSVSLSGLTPYAVTSYQYDAAGRLTAVTDAKNNVTTMTYDSLGRKVAMHDPDMGDWSYDYDANGNLIKQTDAKRQIIHFHYDALNRLTQKDYGGTDPKPLGSGDIGFYYDDYGARP